ncbi:MAG: hypothetical protein ACK5N0_16175 [Synechococcaceae cyanobacterium]
MAREPQPNTTPETTTRTDSAPGDRVSEKGQVQAGMPGSGPDRNWRLPSWTRSPQLHEWIRSGGILIAAAWGVYTFVWKDILVPSWQPANLSLEASLTPVPDRPATPDGLEMTLVVKAVNTSSRSVYPLANIWWLSGFKRTPRSGPSARGDQLFVREADQTLRREALQHVERGVINAPGALLAVGRLFDDDVIDPGGTVQRTILVRVPNGYNAADLRLIVPLLTRRPEGLFHGQQLAWGLSNGGDPLLLMCPAASSAPSGKRPPQCQPADAEADQELQRFDPKKATITLTQQIGLPLGLGAVPRTSGSPP